MAINFNHNAFKWLKLCLSTYHASANVTNRFKRRIFEHFRARISDRICDQSVDQVWPTAFFQLNDTDHRNTLSSRARADGFSSETIDHLQYTQKSTTNQIINTKTNGLMRTVFRIIKFNSNHHQYLHYYEGCKMRIIIVILLVGGAMTSSLSF